MKIKEYINDYLTGEKIEKTPEEPNRQLMLKMLHEDYGYPKELMKEEFGVKRSPSDVKRSLPVDIAVFETVEDMKNRKPKIFVETKKPNYNLGKEQLKDYLMLERDTSFGVWYNGSNDDGQTIAFLKKSFDNGVPKYQEITDIPKHGFNDVSEEVKYSDLKPTSNLKTIWQIVKFKLNI
ncbi:hypothetical protein EQG69_09860 [Levilactobacillus brevis]|uniref:type I restriction enzyme HsdR N-terminal domain-containing protein n=1 Tax=Levilactobacillus brevis TaxID=1580 RepID=UPI000FF6FB96|nr:type I restriction enzyme HsdR N-terminal domain-containing protein [Levilactobacillus brevis]RWZ41966.1 hypothetical protein EQG69_09860 [Levilactobacillus brevis]